MKSSRRLYQKSSSLLSQSLRSQRTKKWKRPRTLTSTLTAPTRSSKSRQPLKRRKKKLSRLFAHSHGTSLQQQLRRLFLLYSTDVEGHVNHNRIGALSCNEICFILSF